MKRGVDHLTQTHDLLKAVLAAPQSRSFSGYWQRGSANHVDSLFGDIFAGLH